jgi:hypothetical protein
MLWLREAANKRIENNHSIPFNARSNANLKNERKGSTKLQEPESLLNNNSLIIAISDQSHNS